MSWLNKTHVGDCRDLLAKMAADGVRVQACITSPPYFGLRDYRNAAQIGLERTPSAYVAELVAVFRLVRDVLADDGTLWLNLGDSYAGSWGAQSRGNTASEATSRLEGSSMLEARQIEAYALGRTHTGSLKNTPGLKAKDLIGIPWRVAFALQADGWYLRSDIIWHKPNPMPESVTDRPTKAHEYLFLLAKSEKYFYDYEGAKEPADVASGERYAYSFGGEKNARMTREEATGAGSRTHPIGYRDFDGMRNRRTVWSIPTKPFRGAHFATFPRELVQPCIIAGSRPGDVVLDPFIGSGTTAQVATDLGRQFIGCELNPAYVELHDLRRTTIGMAI